MSLFRSPARGVKTRAHTKQELTTADEEKKLAKSEVQCTTKDVLERLPPRANSCTENGGGARDGACSHTSSSAARQLRLQYETVKVEIELEEAQAQAHLAKEKARIQKELLEKKMAVDVAELHSRRSHC